MNDEPDLRSLLGRLGDQLAPVPGFAERWHEHAHRVVRGGRGGHQRPVGLRTLAISIAVLGVVGLASAKVLHARFTNGAPTSGVIAVASPSPQASPSAAPVTPNSSPAPSSTATSTATVSPQPSPTPAPDCLNPDLQTTLRTGGDRFAAGSTVGLTLVVTNVATHACRLPPLCPVWWFAQNSAGQRVAAGPMMGLCAMGQPRQTLQPQETTSAYIGEWNTSSEPSGTYLVQGTWGPARASATISVIGAPASPSPRPTPTPSATPTPPLGLP